MCQQQPLFSELSGLVFSLSPHFVVCSLCPSPHIQTPVFTRSLIVAGVRWENPAPRFNMCLHLVSCWGELCRNRSWNCGGWGGSESLCGLDHTGPWTWCRRNAMCRVIPRSLDMQNRYGTESDSKSIYTSTPRLWICCHLKVKYMVVLLRYDLLWICLWVKPTICFVKSRCCSIAEWLWLTVLWNNFPLCNP